MSQKFLLETKETWIGKKSLGLPSILNSRLPLLFFSSMTGSDHSRMFFLLSCLYCPSRSPTTGAPTPDLHDHRRPRLFMDMDFDVCVYFANWKLYFFIIIIMHTVKINAKKKKDFFFYFCNFFNCMSNNVLYIYIYIYIYLFISFFILNDEIYREK